MSKRLGRREFLAGAAGSLLIVAPGAARSYAANGKLDMAAVGVGGRGTGLAKQCSGEHLVAVCDCAENRLNAARRESPQARAYTDYRRLFDECKGLDAVVIATPDHHHFPASMLAVEHGCGVYTEKPLAYSVWEARRLTEFAREKKVATQLGNHGHSGEGCRRLCEMVWGGVLGLATTSDDQQVRKPLCKHYLHLGWVGLVWNIRWLEIPDAFLGWFLLDPSHDDRQFGGWWFWGGLTPLNAQAEQHEAAPKASAKALRRELVP